MNKLHDYLVHHLGMANEAEGLVNSLLEDNCSCQNEYSSNILRDETETIASILREEGHFVDESKKKIIQSKLIEAMNREVDRIEFKSYPLKSISMEESIQNQFRLVDIMHRHFDGYKALEAGDYGCYVGLGRPKRTAEVEKVIAEYFNVEDCCFVRGAGTGAIRAILFATVKRGMKILVHDALMYVTTQITMDGLGAELIRVDFNNIESVLNEVKKGVDMVYIQRTRQQLNDSYDSVELISQIRKVDENVKVVVDENYAVFKTKQLCCEAGADLSTFSCFKVMGVPGVGCIVGKKKYIDKIREQNYSGGGQVQGPEAMEILRSLVNVHALLGVQNLAVEEIFERLSNDEVKHVKSVQKANIEERILLVKLDLPIAKQVITRAHELGAIPNPVGSESRYEVHSLFYRVSRTMMEKNPIFGNYVIRLNPMRSGPNTVIRILKQAIDDVLSQK